MGMVRSGDLDFSGSQSLDIWVKIRKQVIRRYYICNCNVQTASETLEKSVSSLVLDFLSKETIVIIYLIFNYVQLIAFSKYMAVNATKVGF